MKVQVTELTHEEIVDILSTGLSGNNVIGIDYNSDEWEALPEDKKTIDPCFEDKCADLLLAGKTIDLVDFEAEDNGLNGTKGKMVPNDDEWNTYAEEVGLYRIGLTDFLEACSTKEGIGYATTLTSEYGGDFWDGYNLIQIVMFGEVIYG